jgi:hypothetical protein
MFQRKLNLISLILLVGTVASGVLVAQTSTAERFDIVVVRVKPDMAEEFEGLQKSLATALKKTDRGPRDVWETVRGPYRQYHILTPLNDYGSLDESAGPAMPETEWEEWLRQVWRCIVEREVYTARRYVDSSISLKEGRTPHFATVSFRRTAPGMRGAYRSYLRDELIPAYLKAGVDGVDVFRHVYGSGPRRWSVVNYLDRLADLDGPSPTARVAKAIGQEATNALLAKGGKMLVDFETHILRHRPELSAPSPE